MRNDVQDVIQEGDKVSHILPELFPGSPLVPQFSHLKLSSRGNLIYSLRIGTFNAAILKVQVVVECPTRW